MKINDTTMMRLNLTKLMHEQKFSPSTRTEITHHIANCEVNIGNKIVSEIITMINNKTTEKEIRKTMIEKYKMKI